MSRNEARKALEERLGHRFADIKLLERALTHITALPGDQRRDSYQRLEFLGDRVLGLAVSDMLVTAFPKADEGELSRRLAGLVRAETCAEIAIDLDVGPAIRMGAGEAQSGGRRKKAILADICEAIIGAVFIDAGFEAAREVVARFWRDRMEASGKPPRDAKTALQEWAQGRGLAIPVYQETSRTGPDHNPMFRVSVTVDGLAEAEGQGRSKRIAEQFAAEAMLTREGVWKAKEL